MRKLFLLALAAGLTVLGTPASSQVDTSMYIDLIVQDPLDRPNKMLDFRLRQQEMILRQQEIELKQMEIQRREMQLQQLRQQEIEQRQVQQQKLKQPEPQKKRTQVGQPMQLH